MTRRALITDVDDTLHAWVPMWRACYDAAIDWIRRASGRFEHDWAPEFRQFHVRAGTSEAPPTVEDLAPHGLDHRHSEVAALYEDVRRANTTAFPKVADTFAALRARGVLIVAHTDTPPAIAGARLDALGLDGLVDHLFSTVTARTRHDLVESTHLSRTRHAISRTPKPEPLALLNIVRGLNLDIRECVFVGDSLLKDILMARDVGMTSVLAQYGCARDSDSYELLRRVSHWTDADIAREKALKTRGEVTPDMTLEGDFSELLRSGYF